MEIENETEATLTFGCEPVVHEDDRRRLLWLMAEYFRTVGYTDIKARLPGFVPPPVLSGTLEDHRPDFTCRQSDTGRTPIIIPHLGGLNGGFHALFEAGIWDGETVYADTALASTREMEIYLKRYGNGKLLFGSDFPFGIPSSELSKVRHLGLKDADFENVVCTNVQRLIRQEGRS